MTTTSKKSTHRKSGKAQLGTSSVAAPHHDGVAMSESAATSLERFQSNIRRIILKGDTRSSLVTDIASVVGAEILEGARAPGSDLNSVELAASFKTSRTPTREAMVLLEKEGLVEIFPRRRPRVAILSMPEIREIYHIRAAMLGLIAKELAQNAAPTDQLRVALEQMQSSASTGDRDSYFWSNVIFHERFVRLSENRTLERIIESLTLRSLRLRRVTLARPDRIRRSLVDHSRLVDAIEDGEVELAVALIHANIMSALKTLEGLVPADVQT